MRRIQRDNDIDSTLAFKIYQSNVVGRIDCHPLECLSRNIDDNKVRIYWKVLPAIVYRLTIRETLPPVWLAGMEAHHDHPRVWMLGIIQPVVIQSKSRSRSWLKYQYPEECKFERHPPRSNTVCGRCASQDSTRHLSERTLHGFERRVEFG